MDFKEVIQAWGDDPTKFFYREHLYKSCNGALDMPGSPIRLVVDTLSPGFIWRDFKTLCDDGDWCFKAMSANDIFADDWTEMDPATVEYLALEHKAMYRVRFPCAIEMEADDMKFEK